MNILEKVLSKIFTKETIEKAIKVALTSERASILQEAGLKEEITKLKDQLENLKLDKKIEMRDIEHMVKVKEEKGKIELERKATEMEKDFVRKEMALLQSGHQQVLNLITENNNKLQTLYMEIISRLPNVNMEIKRGGK